MQNLKLTISYDGTNYYGWQKQPSYPTVQKTIEDVFRKILPGSSKLILNGSGRTDRGVHALGQVANIKISSKLFLPGLMESLNSLLPRDIRIHSIQKVDDRFNARFNAHKREYRYILQYKGYQYPFYDRYSYCYPYSVDFKKLKKCIGFFSGRKDFSSFSNSPKEKDPVRHIRKILFYREKDFIIFRIIADSFLQGMVRNILGTIFDINKNDQNPRIIKDIFDLKKNKYCGNKIPAKGLYLYKVYY
ncbi:MAG: tRNA pseudouridine(38-40) synthase TruA [Spirochaetes bacterium]|nr:tRNA pseudouridine(38-40) synthase TruA [Spirochaetota bacterium]